MTNIRELGLSTRTLNALECVFGASAPIAVLHQHSEQELLRIPNFGRKALKEVSAAMALQDGIKGPDRRLVELAGILKRAAELIEDIARVPGHNQGAKLCG